MAAQQTRVVNSPNADSVANPRGGGGAAGAQPLFSGKYFKKSPKLAKITKKSRSCIRHCDLMLVYRLHHWLGINHHWVNAGQSTRYPDSNGNVASMLGQGRNLGQCIMLTDCSIRKIRHIFYLTKEQILSFGSAVTLKRRSDAIEFFHAYSTSEQIFSSGFVRRPLGREERLKASGGPCS